MPVYFYAGETLKVFACSAQTPQSFMYVATNLTFISCLGFENVSLSGERKASFRMNQLKDRDLSKQERNKQVFSGEV